MGSAGGKLGKVKHNIKVNLFGAISRKGLAPLVIFDKRMFSHNFQYFLTKTIIPHIRAKYPHRHRFLMDNDPKHTSESAVHFMQINDINHFPTPPESLDLMPIEMVGKRLTLFVLIMNI